MPRQIDHEARRRLIANAVCALADEHGLEGVTLRDVAARAGVSMGAVQRCFRTKEEMLRFALAHVGRRVLARIRTGDDGSDDGSDDGGTGGGTGGDAAETLTRAAVETALLRGEQRAEARVWLAFVAQAAVSPPLAAVLREAYTGLTEMLARLVAAAGGAADPVREAQTLLALADGLTTHVLVGHLTPAAARAALEAHLARLTAVRAPGGRDRLG
ncbi:TetR/AcrR family transcriptional regulator [Streptomyces johnsoniae]|uniref:TetR/AcrR family transcriptional regulator n=1 Tax=Streptomyces johnsoniae TaxID=3075532 RepID=A0ABU2S5A2_9ACTN|nr:TetR/AcrR family transcriptional regulator [Streptomyces sp. DSM 41886]MDT0443866.1 TetR/AcrR family transcriptional regulator [Streptomyces sp. DSM 41886]